MLTVIWGGRGGGGHTIGSEAPYMLRGSWGMLPQNILRFLTP